MNTFPKPTSLPDNSTATPIKQFAIPILIGAATILVCHGGAVNNPSLKHLGVFISAWIYPGFILATIILLSVRARRTANPQFLWWLLDVVVSSLLFVQVLKQTLNMPRPMGTSGAGFPSGHTTFSFALAWLLLQAYPKLGPLWFLLAGAIAWSRIERLDHFPYQINAGLLFGIAIGWSISRLCQGILFPRLLTWRKRTSKTHSPAETNH